MLLKENFTDGPCIAICKLLPTIDGVLPEREALGGFLTGIHPKTP